MNYECPNLCYFGCDWFSRTTFIRHAYSKHSKRLEFFTDQQLQQYYTSKNKGKEKNE